MSVFMSTLNNKHDEIMSVFPGCWPEISFNITVIRTKLVLHKLFFIFSNLQLYQIGFQCFSNMDCFICFELE